MGEASGQARFSYPHGGGEAPEACRLPAAAASVEQGQKPQCPVPPTSGSKAGKDRVLRTGIFPLKHMGHLPL